MASTRITLVPALIYIEGKVFFEREGNIYSVPFTDPREPARSKPSNFGKGSKSVSWLKTNNGIMMGISVPFFHEFAPHTLMQRSFGEQIRYQLKQDGPCPLPFLYLLLPHAYYFEPGSGHPRQYSPFYETNPDYVDSDDDLS